MSITFERFCALLKMATGLDSSSLRSLGMENVTQPRVDFVHQILHYAQNDNLEIILQPASSSAIPEPSLGWHDPCSL